MTETLQLTHFTIFRGFDSIKLVLMQFTFPNNKLLWLTLTILACMKMFSNVKRTRLFYQRIRVLVKLVILVCDACAREFLLKGRISTVNLLILTSSDLGLSVQLAFPALSLTHWIFVASEFLKPCLAIRDTSAASFCHQGEASLSGVFWNFYLV